MEGTLQVCPGGQDRQAGRLLKATAQPGFGTRSSAGTQLTVQARRAVWAPGLSVLVWSEGLL